MIGVVFLSQTIFGIWGNCSLHYRYIFFYFTGCRARSTGLILKHLTVANSLVIAFRGVPQTVEAFGLKIFLSDFGCKLVFYVLRLGRGVSLGTTCLLSVFQAITISPWNSRLAELKVQVLRCTGPCITVFWILYMLVNIIFPLYVAGKWNNKTITKKKDLGFCSGMWNDTITQSLLAAVLTAPDVVCLGLMIWASIYMVFTLYGHKQRVQHIHRNGISRRSPSVTRATQSILVLVSTFVSFYTLSSIFSIDLALSDHPSWWQLNITAMFALCFPSVSPFLLSHESKGLRIFSASCRRNA
ncbi:vomeronasal type-1 receptor 4-like [Equus przewalskii]|uniref:Vomeronasal type-1 receptor n=2 Tax=Equus TaxID=9789 RepID=A0A3Q2I4X7_HORSE|nr:vomeronasal 1 receptor equCabV1R912 [Equus caballus]